MLQDLLIAFLGVLAVVALMAHAPGSAVLLIIVGVFFMYRRSAYEPVLEKQLNMLAGWLARAILAVAVAVIIAGLLTPAPHSVTAFFGTALVLSLLPLTVPLALRGKSARSHSALARHHAIRILRSALGAAAAAFTLVLLSLAGFAWLHINAVISVPQLLALDVLVLALPLSAVQFDAKPPKLLKVSAGNLREHTLSLRALRGYLGFGLLAAVFAYAGYLLAFARQHLNPQFIDPSLPLHREAATLAFATLALCLSLAILFERVDQHENFFAPFLTSNKKLLRAFLGSCLLLLAVIYLPGVNRLFQSAPLSALDWLTALLLAALYGGARLLQRHTRLHTRDAVVKLHHEIQKISSH